MMNNQHWGDVEITFTRALPSTLGQWLKHPSVLLVLILGVGSFVAFILYLRRVLVNLDPSTVIPDRVHNAFDAFSSGVMIVDKSRRIMLANAMLRPWIGTTSTKKLQVQIVDMLPWFKKALSAKPSEHPWVRAMATAATTDGEHIAFRQDSGATIEVIANCAPIMDAGGKLRGCLVTFDNVTHLHQLNAQLLTSMSELTQAKQEIEKKNEDLLHLATRDPLTGCLNRRALFEKLDDLFIRHAMTIPHCAAS